MKKLTARQEEYVRLYLTNGRNANAAYRGAYDCAKMSTASVNKEAQRLLKHPLIAPRIEQIIERVCSRTEISVERVLREYARIGFADMRAFAIWGKDGIALKGNDALSDDDAAAIAEVSESRQGLKIKLHDKKGALDSMAKNLGMFVDKTEITGANGSPLVPILNVTITGNQS